MGPAEEEPSDKDEGEEDRDEEAGESDEGERVEEGVSTRTGRSREGSRGRRR